MLTVLGLDCTSEEALETGLTRRDEVERDRLLPHVLVVGEGETILIPVGPLHKHDTLNLEILLESGESRTATVAIEEGVLGLREKFPLGYHEITADGVTMRLIVAHDSACRVGPGKFAGLGITLYGVRSRRNWGCGDFRDLRDL